MNIVLNVPIPNLQYNLKGFVWHSLGKMVTEKVIKIQPDSSIIQVFGRTSYAGSILKKKTLGLGDLNVP